ncbi:MAG: YifB family Mg chelatase-like AAA ATPase [Lachnospiraceae bacterium]|nr:YifB family Mg chelatase-like AAA ATPase [Lachnospiraceae bacterium]
MFSEAYSAIVQGIEGRIIHVEADVSDGLPCFSLVGYLSSEAKEARERVRIALRNSGFKIPPKKITVNLSPAGIRKDGTSYDFAIAVAILAAFGIVRKDHLGSTALIGELSLGGKSKAVHGVLPMVYTAYGHGMKYVIVPKQNIKEALFVKGIGIIGAESLEEAVTVLNCDEPCRFVYKGEKSYSAPDCKGKAPGFEDISGQDMACRAAEVAAAGMHNFLMAGAPGTGKTMIARRIAGIMPEPQFSECMEISKVYSVAGLLTEEKPVIQERPFRTPHHTITQTALAGGGRYPKPGEISLATGGVLFLDELPEFNRQVLEVLRQPLEDGCINVARLGGNCCYPARFMLVAAMNPCRCGYYPDRKKCTCTPMQVKNYLGKISTPLLDRIDICAETVPLKLDEVNPAIERKRETSEEIRKRVMAAHEIQKERYKNEDFMFNSHLAPSGIRKHCVLSKEAGEYLESIPGGMSFSARAYHKILKTGRTIADLEGKGLIEKVHIAEALCYRNINDKYWREGRE